MADQKKLTSEQLALIEENRRRALELRKRKIDSIKNAESKKAPAQTNTQKSVLPTETINLTLVSKDRFELVLSKFDAHVIELAKRIDSKRYNGATRTWNFALPNYEELKNTLKGDQQVASRYTIQEVHNNVLKNLIKRNNQNCDVNLNTLVESHICPTIYRRLMPFQKESLFAAIENNGRILLADDMGLGKTLQALAIANFYKCDWPLLIVCPSSLRKNWQESVGTWYADLDNLSVLTFYTKSQIAATPQMNINKESICICSYECLSALNEKFANFFKITVADESHYLKNSKSERTKNFFATIKNSVRVILLSATPALSKPAELYPQIKAVQPGLFGSFYAFANRYCDPKPTNFGFNFDGSSNMAELSVVLENLIMLRRLKSEVVKNLLPQKTRNLVYLENAKLNFDSVKNQNYSTLSRNFGNFNIDKKTMSQKILELFNLTAQIKAPAVCDYIEHEALALPDKCIFFAHHQFMLDKFIRVDGSTPAKKREELFELFQNDPLTFYAVLSINTTSVGVSLTAAKKIFFCELFWNPGVLSQAEDRIYRIGQTNDVTVTYLVARGTSDDRLWQLLGKKLTTLADAKIQTANINNVACIDYYKRIFFGKIKQKEKKMENFFDDYTDA